MKQLPFGKREIGLPAANIKFKICRLIENEYDQACQRRKELSIHFDVYVYYITKVNRNRIKSRALQGTKN